MLIPVVVFCTVRKASQKHKEKKDRKLSIHVDLPQDAHPIESTSEISVVDAEKEDSLLMGEF